MSTKEHYDNHLAPVYSWTLGDLNERVAEQSSFFMSHGIKPETNNIAFDLGSGNGLQAIALANIGFQVTAVDFNHHLLTELMTRANSLSVESVESDILTFLRAAPAQPALIVCMGDTLTHLKDYDTVQAMVRRAADLLMVDGTMVLSYRDLTQELKGTDRFIHVRSDDTRTMTCFLEYFPAHVMVNDIIVEKQNGSWRQTVSHYPKLRLSESAVVALLSQNGINVVSRTMVGGMLHLIGRKSIRRPPSV